MKRRTFLQYNALAALSLSPLLANPHAHHNIHQQSDHSAHNAHTLHKNHNKQDTSFITLENENLKLLDSGLFPQNQPLQPLTLLTNTSKEQGKFQAKIIIDHIYKQIIQGKKTLCYAYIDGTKQAKNINYKDSMQSLSAPKIEVYEGDIVEIEVQNNLQEPTTIHWHGLPVPPDQDGHPMDSIPAGKSRIYRFSLPKGSAGTYWYHPHPHYMTHRQIFMGLAGAFVVKSRNDVVATQNPPLKESDWFITDLRLDSNAQIPENGLSDWLDGREGEFVLINGYYKPKIALDSTERIRIYNATSARYLQLHIQGASFLVLGTDGGLLESPQEEEIIMLPPANRIEVVIKNAKSGNFTLKSHYYDRHKMAEKKEAKKDIELAQIHANESFKPARIPQKLRTFPKQEKSTHTLEITMSEDHSNMHNLSTQTKEELQQNLASMFLMNGKTFDMDRIDLRVKKGVWHDVVVTNKSHMDHPFHIHGTQFEVIEYGVAGKMQKPPFRAFFDTINIKPNESMRLRMRQDFAGLRMFHCHIVEHEDLGMMGHLEVQA